MAKERALDIFMLLEQIDRKNYAIWGSLTDEQRKEFSPLVTMRWMAGCTVPVQLILLNEIVNLSVFSLPDHRELLLKLLTVCSSGKSKRYQWINYKAAGGRRSKRAVDLISEHYKMTEREADDARRLFSDEEIMQLAEDQGWQKDELRDLQKELK